MGGGARPGERAADERATGRGDEAEAGGAGGAGAGVLRAGPPARPQAPAAPPQFWSLPQAALQQRVHRVRLWYTPSPPLRSSFFLLGLTPSRRHATTHRPLHDGGRVDGPGGAGGERARAARQGRPSVEGGGSNDNKKRKTSIQQTRVPCVSPEGLVLPDGAIATGDEGGVVEHHYRVDVVAVRPYQATNVSTRTRTRRSAKEAVPVKSRYTLLSSTPHSKHRPSPVPTHSVFSCGSGGRATASVAVPSAGGGAGSVESGTSVDASVGVHASLRVASDRMGALDLP